MRSRIAKHGRANLGVILGVFALVVALTGGAAVASHGHFLKLGMFDKSSRDRLAGTGVIQYAKKSHNTGAVSAASPKTFSVKCEKKKKATAGGFKWAKGSPPTPESYELLDSYPNGSGFVVRLYILTGPAVNEKLEVYANCVKSRKQRGTPPS